MKSFRSIDSANEKLVAQFLDDYFYLPSLFEKVERVSDKQEQLKGKDIIVSSKRLSLVDAIIDEKDTAHYVNKDIPTFAFELSFMVGNMEVEGWLTDESKETEYYLLLYPFATLEEPVTKPPQFKEVTKVRYILVRRQDVINLLKEAGFDRNALQRKAKEVRTTVGGYDDNQRNKAEDKAKYGFYFMYTYFLNERPVNVVIPRAMLERIAIIQGFCEKPLL